MSLGESPGRPAYPQDHSWRRKSEDLLGGNDRIIVCTEENRPLQQQWPLSVLRRISMKKNFRLVSLVLVLAMVLGLALTGCGAKDKDPANAAFVTLTVQGELAQDKNNAYLAATAIEIPAEGTNVGEVLKALHKNFFKDGEAGYATAASQYGDTITKLWGIENGGAYGYYVNGAMSMGLTDPVKPGDRVEVFVYKDAAAYSDVYTYMTAEVSGDKVTVKVQAVGFDANWNPVMNPLKGAKIYYLKDGKLEGTGAVTGDDGTATFTLKNGIYRIVSIDTDAVYTVSAQKITVKK